MNLFFFLFADICYVMSCRLQIWRDMDTREKCTEQRGKTSSVSMNMVMMSFVDDSGFWI